MSWDAPAGVPWLVWLVILLIFGPPALGSKIAARIPGVLGATGRWWQARKIAHVSHDELGRIRVELTELHADYDRVVPDLRERVNKLEEALDTAQRRLWAFRDHVRDLKDTLRRYAPHAPVPAPPEEISDIV
ncbi:hypothetical protein [Tsukamurella tyrosinosolvens]|uniref:hypothetical protein n=1 Tax=Tsukamurella tyrosinosolvens TaxID=57704 RepID=UPI003461FCB3